jgi:putative PIN family toxin of toxin-antitoxin system
LEIGKLLLSESTLNELDDVLRRPKFDAYLPETKRLEFLLSLIEASEVIDVTQNLRVCRDPKDDKFLELAVAGNASWIVSGDQDLLTLKQFQQVEIISPRDFLERQHV